MTEAPTDPAAPTSPSATELAPAEMAGHLAGYTWERDEVGESGDTVNRLRRPGYPDLFLKHGQGHGADGVAAERDRLTWLAGHLPVPRVVAFVRSGDEAWLLTSAIPGRTAHDILDTARDDEARLTVVDALAGFMRRLHAIPADLCPFDARHDVRLRQARSRIDAGLVDEDDFDDERDGWTAEQVWAGLQKFVPESPDLVVTHGDFSLDNLLMSDGEITGCIDVGRAGVADRYQDVAILWNCLGEFDGTLQERLLRSYDVGNVDQRRLQFHLMLDELF